MKGLNAPKMKSVLEWQKHATRMVTSCSNDASSWLLGQSMLEELDPLMFDDSLEGGARLFSEGETARFIYAVRTGYVKLSARVRDREMILQVAGPESVLGLYAVLSTGMYEVSATSCTTTRLRAIETSAFLDQLRSRSDLHDRTLNTLCLGYRAVLRDACRLGLEDTAARRLGCLLVELGEEIGEHLESGKIRFPMVLTREELGSMISITRETTTRLLCDFCERGWIEINHFMVTLNQPENLCGEWS